LCDSSNDAVITSDYKASDGKMTKE
jgi:hypothetical protein